MKKLTIFYELNPFNIVPALILKLFTQVLVYRFSPMINKFTRLKKNFERINDFKSHDTWQSHQQYAYRELKKLYQAGRTKECVSDKETIALQYLAIDFEQIVFFSKLTEQYNTDKMSVFPPFFYYTFPVELKILSSNIPKYGYAIEFMFQFSLLVARFIKVLKLAFLRKGTEQIQKKYKYLSYGISPQESPRSSMSFSFAWMSENNVIKPDDILYITQFNPAPDEQEYLRANNINHVHFNQLHALLSPFDLLEVLSHHFREIVCLLRLSKSYISLKNYRLKSQNSVLTPILKRLNPDIFFCSLSEAWPLSPLVYSCISNDIHPIVWFYGAGEFGYSSTNQSFSDEKIRFCFMPSIELWTWNQATKDLILSRQINSSELLINVTGPLVNAKFNKFNNADKKSKLAVAVFDLSPITQDERLQKGLGPGTNLHIHERFFSSIKKMASDFPNIDFHIKTKRNTNQPQYQVVKSLSDLYNQTKLTNIKILAPDQNPLDLLARTCACIAIPYTSPAMLYLANNKPGIYYDPTGEVKFTFKNIFKPITISNEEELRQFLQKLQHSDWTYPNELHSIDSISTEQTYSIIMNRLKENSHGPSI